MVPTLKIKIVWGFLYVFILQIGLSSAICGGPQIDLRREFDLFLPYRATNLPLLISCLQITFKPLTIWEFLIFTCLRRSFFRWRFYHKFCLDIYTFSKGFKWNSDSPEHPDTRTIVVEMWSLVFRDKVDSPLAPGRPTNGGVLQFRALCFLVHFVYSSVKRVALFLMDLGWGWAWPV